MGLYGIVTTLVAALLGLVGLGGTPPVGPSYRGDFPDPAIVLDHGTYWAYATGSGGRNLQVMSSPDLAHWTPPVDPLPVLPSWASPGFTWAPGVLPRAGGFVMYYTVRDTTSGRQCISVAAAPTPSGPFVDTSAAPLVCQLADGGSIDPNPFVDPATGRLVLLWKSDDNAHGAPTHLWAQLLSADGLTLAGSPAELLTETAAWQTPSVEGPTMVRDGSAYYLFYSANDYTSASSGIGFASCTSALGPCVERSSLGPWLGSRGSATGPQGPWVFTDASGALRLAYAAWDGAVGYQNGGARSLWVGTLSFRLGYPALR